MAAPRDTRVDVRQAQRRAITKALASGLHKRVVRLRYGRYLVASTSRDLVHTVTHPADRPSELHCTCEGRHHPACVHRSAVFLAKIEAGGARVVAPTTVERRAA